MTPEEQAKAAFIQEHFEAKVQSAALSRLKIQQDDLLVIGELMWGHEAGFLGSAMVELEALKEVTRDMDFPRKAFASLGQPQMTQLIVLSLLERAYVRLEDVLVERGVNMEALAKKAKEEAENLWRVHEEAKSAAAKNGSPKGGKEVDAVPAGQKS